MNWKTILTLSLLGAIMGLLSVYGISKGYIEFALWMVIALISALTIERTTQKQLVTHGFLVGFLDGLFHGIVVAIFADTYFMNRPEVLEQYMQMGEGIPLSLYPVIASVLTGIVYGLFIGLIVYLTRKTTKRQFS
ncbi:MAG TPA: hypothetical protein VK004_07175 [Ignavibacteria bacterium]|nr:hypothetical protein [Ignavibacteria bacterium]